MEIQEKEEIEFRPASEAQNCLAEAEARIIELSSRVVEVGVGPILLTVRYPYYCKATDGFAGMAIAQLIRFPNREEATACIERLGNEHDELTYEITPPLSTPPQSTEETEVQPPF